jgi:hypothetical protein
MSVSKTVAPPKGERILVSYLKDDVLAYIITIKDNNREFYYLYEASNGALIKLGKSKSPLELEDKYEISAKLGVLNEVNDE